MPSWQGSEITEASGLAYSLKWASLAYVHNDENGPVFAVNLTTGKTVGKASIKGLSLVDPEDIDIDVDGLLWLADIGNNDAESGRVPAVYTHREFGPNFIGSVGWVKHALRYPGNTPHNAETFMNWPNRKRQIVSKEAAGSVFELPKDADLKTGNAVNQLKLVHGPDSDLDYVSGGVTAKDGKWGFLTRKDHNSTLLVVTSSWEIDDEIPIGATMVKPEGVGRQQDGKRLWVCDDKGSAGGNYRSVLLPKKYWPQTVPNTPPPPPPPAVPCGA